MLKVGVGNNGCKEAAPPPLVAVLEADRVVGKNGGDSAGNQQPKGGPLCCRVRCSEKTAADSENCRQKRRGIGGVSSAKRRPPLLPC
jgi:hypothetical protein